jgi:hypothetical protein
MYICSVNPNGTCNIRESADTCRECPFSDYVEVKVTVEKKNDF